MDLLYKKLVRMFKTIGYNQYLYLKTYPFVQFGNRMLQSVFLPYNYP